jgi:hypothetical protein
MDSANVMRIHEMNNTDRRVKKMYKTDVGRRTTRLKGSELVSYTDIANVNAQIWEK